MEQKIQILLKEYDTLRTEILARYNNLWQLITLAFGITTVLLSWINSEKGLGAAFWVSLVTIAAMITGLWFLLHLDTSRAAARIREIESEINKTAGAELLQWETRWGRSRLWAVNELEK